MDDLCYSSTIRLMHKIFSYLSYSLATQPIVMENGKCLAHFDDNYDGKIEFSKLSPMQLDSNEDCKSACSSTIFYGCRYTENGACLYNLTVSKIKNQDGPWDYECEITNDGMIYMNGPWI